MAEDATSVVTPDSDVAIKLAPEPAGAWLTVALTEQWQRVRARDDRWFWLALAVALSVHALPILLASGVLAIVGIGQPGHIGAGDPKGVPDGVNVETIDAAEYDRRYISFSKGRDDADTVPDEPAAGEPTESKPTKNLPEQHPQPPQLTSTLKPDEMPLPDAVVPVEQPKTTPTKPAKLTAADIAEILESTRLDRPIIVETMSKAGALRQGGPASAFIRGVWRRLKDTVPVPPNGLTGTVVVGLIVSATGGVGLIQVLESSGNPQLDTFVVEQIRATQLITPDKATPEQERRFRITYEYN